MLHVIADLTFAVVHAACLYVVWLWAQDPEIARSLAVGLFVGFVTAPALLQVVRALREGWRERRVNARRP